MHSDLKASHSSSISLIPITLGVPPTKILKLQENVSSSDVSLNSFAMSLSGSVPLFKSIVILSPSSPVSSRISEISRTFPSFESSTTFSIINSLVVVGGIFDISMQLYFLS